MPRDMSSDTKGYIPGVAEENHDADGEEQSSPLLPRSATQPSSLKPGGLFVPIQDLAPRHEDDLVMLLDVVENLLK